MKTKKLFFLIITTLFLTQSYTLAGSEVSESLTKKNNNKETKECFENFSRGVFSFNQGLDRALFEPIAKTYRKLPQPIRKGSGNVVSNLSLLVTIPNNLLQGNVKQAGSNVARLALNSTIGILGIFDPATSVGLKYKDKEDYGQTLGAWGTSTGCYFVLPVLGPTTVRDFSGSVINLLGGDPWYNITVRNDTNYVKNSDYYMSRGAHALDFRAKNIESFDSIERNSVDFYASVKSLYLQDRNNKINNSKATTETQDDSDWEEIETK